MSYIIRSMNPIEIDVAIKWASKEGWNPGHCDGIQFYDIDPGGFFIGLLDDKPIACISAVAHSSEFGFIGFYIVEPEHRGNGYGIQIWNKAVEYLGGRNIGLDGVIEQVYNYQKSGFELAYQNVRFEGVTKHFSDKHIEVVELSSIPFEKLVEFDRKYFFTSRPQFLRTWIQQPKSFSFSTSENDELTGYVVARRCVKGYKIGPLFSENREIAEALFCKVNNALPEGTFLYLDVPDVNKDGINLAEFYNMTPIFKTARMYTKGRPKQKLNHVFGVTTFEIG